MGQGVDRVDFRELRARVPLLDVLAARGLLHHLRRQGDRLVGPCPLHGGDNRSAFLADLRRGVWYCFTHCAGGDVIDLVRRLDGSTFTEAAATVAALALNEGTTLVPNATPGQPPTSRIFRPYRRALPLDPTTPFLARKGIRAPVAARYEVGGYRGSGWLKGCVGVRLHDVMGIPLGYAGRRLDPDEARHYGKWRFPPGIPKAELLYGYHRLRNPTELVVVECPWGVLRLAQLGVPAVALLGTRLSNHQRALLQSHVAHLVVMLDADGAGRQGSEAIQRDWAGRVDVVGLPDDKDPDDLTDAELLAALPPLGADRH